MNQMKHQIILVKRDVYIFNFVKLSDYEKQIFLLDDNSETNKDSIDSPKDEESQNIPSVPSNPPVLRTQSHDSQDSISYKTEGKFCVMQMLCGFNLEEKTNLNY